MRAGLPLYLKVTKSLDFLNISVLRYAELSLRSRSSLPQVKSVAWCFMLSELLEDQATGSTRRPCEGHLPGGGYTRDAEAGEDVEAEVAASFGSFVVLLSQESRGDAPMSGHVAIRSRSQRRPRSW
jgi:hypothetical protein